MESAPDAKPDLSDNPVAILRRRTQCKTDRNSLGTYRLCAHLGNFARLADCSKADAAEPTASRNSLDARKPSQSAQIKLALQLRFPSQMRCRSTGSPLIPCMGSATSRWHCAVRARATCWALTRPNPTAPGSTSRGSPARQSRSRKILHLRHGSDCPRVKARKALGYSIGPISSYTKAR